MIHGHVTRPEINADCNGFISTKPLSIDVGYFAVTARGLQPRWAEANAG